MHEFYIHQLYPFQDEILKIINDKGTPFYLSGGTAASRGYLNHRFSDDLDLFVNDDEQFPLFSDRIIQALTKKNGLELNVILKESRFVRFFVEKNKMILKVELINDVPSHIGEIMEHGILGKLDSAENILANKITAIIDRREPKDFSDIWGFCVHLKMSLKFSIENAQSKSAGIFEPDLARVLTSLKKQDWELVKWVNAPDFEHYRQSILKLADDLIF